MTPGLAGLAGLGGAGMGGAGLAAAVVVAVGGGALAGAGLWGRRRARSGAMAYLSEVGGGLSPAGPASGSGQGSAAGPGPGPGGGPGGPGAGAVPGGEAGTSSFVQRVLAPVVAWAVDKVGALTPARYLDRLHGRLLVAGLAGRLSAAEMLTLHVLAVVSGLVVGVGVDLLARPKPASGLLLVILLATAGLLGPPAWLRRGTRRRQDSIRSDLPDVLDLLAIAVEAGTGLEGALELVCVNFATPLGEELARTLKEMELGLTRREALQNLKRRTEVSDLSGFVLALVQADTLGMPIGPILRAQAAEMRLRRRQWAKERAAKLPVKMLFPMITLIFPAIFIVVLGPAAASIFHALRGIR
ncbi:MAG: type II secretion system F family protein [Acidimicrobiales bacterium]